MSILINTASCVITLKVWMIPCVKESLLILTVLMHKRFLNHKHSKLVKLVGNRPLVNYSLNDKMFEGLWDTGSMISLISKTWLDFEFPKQTVYPIESFIGAGEGEFSLKAANNSEIDIEGIVLFDFGISNHDEKFTVPFIVTNQNIDNAIKESHCINIQLSTHIWRFIWIVTDISCCSNCLSQREVFIRIDQ